MATSAINNNNLDFLDPGMSVLVVGLGKTGLAAVKFFLQKGALVSVSDSSPRDTLDPKILTWLENNDVPCETGGHSVNRFTAVDLIFVSPGIPLTIEPLIEAKRCSIPVLGELAIAAHYLKTPVVGITGTNGKTTVTTLLGDIFRAGFEKVFVGGNIGTPLLEYISGPQDNDIVVAEISSFQLDTGGADNGLPFKVAVLLNISPDHLERYTSYAAYVDSKFKIFRAQSPDDFAVLNGDDPEIMNRRHLWPESRKFFFGRELADLAGAQIKDGKIILKNSSESALPDNMSGEEYDLSGTGLKNPPNLQNGAAAILAARLMGCRQKDIIQGLLSFKPLAHRMSLVAEIDGVRYIDDSKATNVGALYSAINAIDQPIILIAGGRDKGGDYSDLYEPVRRKVKQILLIGEAKDKMKRAFMAYADIETLETLQEAVVRAAELAAPGDIVLLSPACASFDMFKSYAERGDVFIRSVKAIKNRSTPKVEEHLSQ
ncbi:MAG: UDP-N-acetylmuramoyl-L-alanine--D-glutamate ligase [Deltaproteobacteria bacterium]|jgi:UDP-N-acetylmuramoylalanine--D-glutamate ligase|nr:UDP-N-acetylmuramoyl-L-alanine--D-glutamate ligase [Deltaproteobacteria bacterium]